MSSLSEYGLFLSNAIISGVQLIASESDEMAKPKIQMIMEIKKYDKLIAKCT